jgi:2,5-diketo-D-gluconate reductase A
MARVSAPGIPYLTLSDGRRMPALGFGVYKVAPEGTQAAVAAALAAGYRLIDTAALYRNEDGVGRAIAASGLPREDLFVTTKVWNTDQGYEATLRAFDVSLGQLGLSYVDLYLIHWPMERRDLYRDTWRALERLHADGRARSIGVSNFNPGHLDRLRASASACRRSSARQVSR